MECTPYGVVGSEWQRAAVNSRAKPASLSPSLEDGGSGRMRAWTAAAQRPARIDEQMGLRGGLGLGLGLGRALGRMRRSGQEASMDCSVGRGDETQGIGSFYGESDRGCGSEGSRSQRGISVLLAKSSAC